jgi:hypothetical protein
MNLPNCSHDDDTTVPILVSILMDDDSSISSSSLSYNSLASSCHSKISAATTTGSVSHHSPVVRFSTVTIIEFPPILGGDTVPSSGGPPVALGSTPCRTMIHDVEQLELGRSTNTSSTTATTCKSSNTPWCYHPRRRSSKELLLSGETRTEMLVDAGYSLTFLSRDTVKSFHIHQKRMETTQMLYAEWEAEQQQQQQDISETPSYSTIIQKGRQQHQQQQQEALRQQNLEQELQQPMKTKDTVVCGGPSKSQQQQQQPRTSLFTKVVLSARFLAWSTRRSRRNVSQKE